MPLVKQSDPAPIADTRATAWQEAFARNKQHALKLLKHETLANMMAVRLTEEELRAEHRAKD